MSFNFMAAITICSDFGAQKIKSDPLSTVSSSICHEVLGFPGGSEVKVSASNAGDLGSIPGLGRSPGERNGYPL